MSLWKISCYSNCGTYFRAYLQSVMVIASSKDDAIKETKKWLKKEGRNFIESDSSKWDVQLVTNQLTVGYVDHYEESDY